MISTPKSSSITMPTASTTAHINTPSPSTDKETRDASNHDNAQPPIQAANSQNSWLSARTTTLTSPNAIHSQESTNKDPTFGLDLLYEAAMQHGQCLNKTQDYSDTNKTKESTIKTANQAPVIFIEKKTLQHNSPPSNSEESKTYVCNYIINTVNEDRICGKQFLGEAELTKHMEIHTKRKNHVCRFCERIFDFPSFLKAHERIHTGETPYPCAHCDKKFTSKHYLRVHERNHTGEKPYPCDHCDKKFTSKHYLRIHERNHTGEKPYKCNICDKSFTQRSGLYAHKKIHFTRTPFICDICKKTLVTRSSFEKHKRIHTGEKLYKCNICDKSFTQNGTLINHSRIHTEDNYICDICGKSITDKPNFIRHMRRHRAME